MPARESTFDLPCEREWRTLKDGRVCYLSNGCLVHHDERGQHTVAGSRDAWQYLLDHAVLTSDERRELLDRGPKFYEDSGIAYTFTRTHITSTGDPRGNGKVVGEEERS